MVISFFVTGFDTAATGVTDDSDFLDRVAFDVFNAVGED